MAAHAEGSADTPLLEAAGPTRRRVLLVGWDAADWQVIDPLLQQGKMPSLARLIARGVRGSIATLQPPLSPMLWTSIATGKRPHKHGIHGFAEPTPDGMGIRPVSAASRTTRAIWNMLSERGLRTAVVGWWPSHPAEAINGVMVSNHFQRATGPPRRWPLMSGSVHPPELAAALSEFRLHPAELTAEHILPFVPRLAEIDQDSDPRPASIARTLAEITSIHGAATALLQQEPWDLLCVYYDGIDHFSHGFMRYHPPRESWVDERGYELYSGVMEAAYRYHDMMLGALLALAGPEVTVVLVSDHGFHSGRLRPSSVPAEPAGPAAEHRDLGIFVAAGPGLAAGRSIYGTSILDVCPTVLMLLGLPVGLDMDGRPRTDVLDVLDGSPAPEEVSFVHSWDRFEGDNGRDDGAGTVDSGASAEAMRQLVALGYVDAPGDDIGRAVRETSRELSYNLARALLDADLPARAAAILEDLWQQWPREHRFATHLITALGLAGRLAERGAAIERLAAQVPGDAEWAEQELQRLERELSTEPGLVDAGTSAVDGGAAATADPGESAVATATARGTAASEVPRGTGDLEAPSASPEPVQIQEPGPANTGRPDRREANPRQQQEIRRLLELIQPKQPLIDLLRATQRAMEGDAAGAVALIEPLLELEGAGPGLHDQLGALCLRINDLERAQQAFRRSAETDPNKPAPWLGLARVAGRRRDWPAMADAALCAIELRRFNPPAHLMLGRALLRIGETDAAIAALQMAVSQSPSLAPAHAMLAYACRRAGQTQQAMQHRAAAAAARRRRRVEHAVRTGADATPRAGHRDADRSRPPAPAPSAASPLEQLDGPMVQPTARPIATPAGTHAVVSRPPLLAFDHRAAITIVSGLPRSGTSMMMQMLAAGGIPPYTDGERAADADNPRGYFEHADARRLHRDASWLPASRGRAVKIVAQLLGYLPSGERYNVVLMHRDIADVLASQRDMLRRLGAPGAASEGRDQARLAETFGRQLEMARAALAQRADARVIDVRFDEALAEPLATAARLGQFFGSGFSADGAAGTVDAGLARHHPEAGAMER